MRFFFMKRMYLTLLIVFTVTISNAGSLIQQKNIETRQFQHFKDISLITGFQTGSSNSNFIELGIGLKHEYLMHHPAHAVFYFSNELLFKENFVLGTKVGANFGANMMDLGINLINYTNFTNNSLRFKPEFGLGFGKFRVYYGYNLALTNKDFNDINEHLIGINILLDIKDFRK